MVSMVQSICQQALFHGIPGSPGDSGPLIKMVLVFKSKGWPKSGAQNAHQTDFSFSMSIRIFLLKNLEAVSGWCQEQQLFL